MMSQRVERVIQEVQKTYSVPRREIQVVRSPLRVCPLGAHIDHQLGPVTGTAIDRSILLAFASSNEPHVRLRSLDFSEEVAFNLNAIPPAAGKDWGNYPRGAASALLTQHPLSRGLVGCVAGDLPIGGLSSSAAVGVAYLLALETVNGVAAGPLQNIHFDRLLENEYIGLNNGILDQSMILLSEKGRLVYLDCREYPRDPQGCYRRIPIPRSHPPCGILVAYSGVTEALVGTGYNKRVDECHQAGRALLDMAGLPAEDPVKLRNVPREVYEEYKHRLQGVLRKRADHFFGECDRVERGVEAWERGDLIAFGHLMTESGRSSVEKYECGSPELRTLYDILRSTEGVYGARFSGAGFRGSCVALVDPAQAPAIESRLRDRYPKAHPRYAETFDVFLCTSANGAEVLPRDSV